MFGEFFKLCKKYWEELLNDSKLFYEEFKQYPISMHLTNALFNAQRDKYKNK